MTPAAQLALTALFHARLHRALVLAAGPEARTIPVVAQLARHAAWSAYRDLVALGEQASADRAMRRGVRS